MNLDEKSLFLDAMEDVKPLKNCNSSRWLKPAQQKVVQKPDIAQLDNFLTADFLEIIPLATPLEFKREGLQTGVLDKLRLGKYQQQANLNLIRQPVEQCRQMLFVFIQEAKKAGLRNVLIVHGKGREDKSHANIVRSYLARWLMEFEEVQAFCCAMPHHGGSGACYVALKKSPQEKVENRERHAKHSR
ncbi:DNA endonuclease SmrA [Buttiauxella warmboldiae]|uniref:DNA endonuclease SmrA n=1 Tax=Buttiauxella warmboldiae TaxID=82993 RepID=A0A3N5DSY3_9ENTR|nr:DNA endonuclease SmrA [Buttiauxella warmboldiae]RPH30697.1 DNA endonuclease SmrA [Buttiauxella warmboldiae]